MKSARAAAFLVVLGAASVSAAVAGQQVKRAESLSISVTVDPTCTVAVAYDRQTPDDAVELACRNFRNGQPEPLLLESAPRDGRDVVWIRF